MEWNGKIMEMEIPLSKYQLVSNMIFLITSWNSAIMSPKSEKQCMFYVSESRSMVGTKICITLIHVLFGQQSSNKYGLYPPPTIQKMKGFDAVSEILIKCKRIKWTLTRNASFFLSLGEILPSVQAHVNSSLYFWIKSLFPHKY